MGLQLLGLAGLVPKKAGRTTWSLFPKSPLRGAATGEPPVATAQGASRTEAQFVRLSVLAGTSEVFMADQVVRILILGAHPDDADIKAGGTAAKWCARGHVVKMVSVTDGRHGHQTQWGDALATRRRAE